jgi:hypothetical protein
MCPKLTNPPMGKANTTVAAFPATGGEYAAIRKHGSYVYKITNWIVPGYFMST